jgi:hypothetical protein
LIELDRQPMTDDKKYKPTCFTEGDKSTFSVLVSRDSEVRLLYCIKTQEGELRVDRFDFRLLGFDCFEGLPSISRMDVVVFSADLLVSQIEIDLEPLQGRYLPI